MAESPSYTPIHVDACRMNGRESTMTVGRAPTRDPVTQGVFEHIWIKVTDNSRTTYFDCCGSHEGPNFSYIQGLGGRCDLNLAVRMATGHAIGLQHPCQHVYGESCHDGVETCGVFAGGLLDRTGQCHQIANRLLHICDPRSSLDHLDLQDQPRGYGLTRCMFGPYGRGFDAWCKHLEIPPPDERDISTFLYILRVVRDRDRAVELALLARALAKYAMRTLATSLPRPPGPQRRGATHQSRPNGLSLPDQDIADLLDIYVTEFFGRAQAQGFTDEQLAMLTNLTATEVRQRRGAWLRR